MAVPIFQVDAFTNTPFQGNPAGVCILSEPGDEKWMQNVAGEMNLSETAFLCRAENGLDLRWFTPGTEVELCGHATLASAHILWEMGYFRENEQILFNTKSGVLTARKINEWIELNFPAEPPAEAVIPAEIIDALGIEPVYAGKNRFDYLIEVQSEEIVRGIRPDFNILKAAGSRGVIVTGRALKEFDFVSRFFAPAVGIDEDPVTGSAHCCLGPFWGKRLNRDRLLAYQASERGGIVKVRTAGDRVYLGGQAVTIFKGELNVSNNNEIFDKLNQTICSKIK